VHRLQRNPRAVGAVVDRRRGPPLEEGLKIHFVAVQVQRVERSRAHGVQYHLVERFAEPGVLSGRQNPMLRIRDSQKDARRAGLDGLPGVVGLRLRDHLEDIQ